MHRVVLRRCVDAAFGMRRDGDQLGARPVRDRARLATRKCVGIRSIRRGRGRTERRVEKAVALDEVTGLVRDFLEVHA